MCLSVAGLIRELLPLYAVYMHLHVSTGITSAAAEYSRHFRPGFPPCLPGRVPGRVPACGGGSGLGCNHSAGRQVPARPEGPHATCRSFSVSGGTHQRNPAGLLHAHPHRHRPAPGDPRRRRQLVRGRAADGQCPGGAGAGQAGGHVRAPEDPAGFHAGHRGGLLGRRARPGLLDLPGRVVLPGLLRGLAAAGNRPDLQPRPSAARRRRPHPARGRRPRRGAGGRCHRRGARRRCARGSVRGPAAAGAPGSGGGRVRMLVRRPVWRAGVA